MDISKYAAYFHDGYVNAIIHKGNNIEFFLESSVMDSNEVSEMGEKVLSESNTLKGILLLRNIKKMKVGNKEFKGTLQKQYDDGDILDLEVEDGRIFLLVEWKNYPPKAPTTDVSKIEIEAEEVEWIPEAQ